MPHGGNAEVMRRKTRCRKALARQLRAALVYTRYAVALGGIDCANALQRNASEGCCTSEVELNSVVCEALCMFDPELGNIGNPDARGSS